MEASSGLWRSPVAHLVRIERVRGSNPLSSTDRRKGLLPTGGGPFVVRASHAKGPPPTGRALAVRARRDGREGTYSLWREVLRTGAPSLTGEASIPWSGERRAHRHDTVAAPGADRALCAIFGAQPDSRETTGNHTRVLA